MASTKLDRHCMYCNTVRLYGENLIVPKDTYKDLYMGEDRNITTGICSSFGCVLEHTLAYYSDVDSQGEFEDFLEEGLIDARTAEVKFMLGIITPALKIASECKITNPPENGGAHALYFDHDPRAPARDQSLFRKVRSLLTAAGYELISHQDHFGHIRDICVNYFRRDDDIALLTRNNFYGYLQPMEARKQDIHAEEQYESDASIFFVPSNKQLLDFFESSRSQEPDRMLWLAQRFITEQRMRGDLVTILTQATKIRTGQEVCR